MIVSPDEFEPGREENSSEQHNGAMALAHALDVSDEPVYIYDTQGKCQWVNRSGEKLLHLDASEITGRYIFELFPGQSRFQIKAWRRVIDAKEPSSFVSEAPVNGHSQKFQTSIFPVMDYDGRVQSVVSVGRAFEDREVLQYENQMRGAELDLTHEISSILTSSLEIGEVYEHFAAEFKKLVDFDRIVIMELDHAGDGLLPNYFFHVGMSEPSMKSPMSMSRTGLEWSIKNQRTNIENDLRVSRKFGVDDKLLEQGIRSVIRVPLITRNGIIGVMALGSYHPNMFGDREQVVTERVAAQIAPAIENARLYQEAQEYTNELEVIDEISSVVTSSLRLEEVYQRFASGVRRLVECDRISVTLLSEDGQTANQEFSTIPNPFNLGKRNPWKIENTALGWVIENRESHIESDLSQSINFESDRFLHEAGIRSVIRVPFVSKDKAIGGFALNSSSPNAFGHRECRVLERLAAQIAPAIENAHLYREAQERTRELEVIDDVATIMTSNLHPEQVYDRFASEVKKLVDFDRMAIILQDKESRDAVITYVTGLNTGGLQEYTRWPLEGSHLQWVLNHWESLTETDLAQHTHFRFADDEWLFNAGLRSGLRVPLLNKSQIIGTFTLWSRKPDAYGARELRIVERLATQIEPAIENARLYEEVEQSLERERSAQEQLVRVERLRAMGELSSGVAHDLNNALAAILGRTQLLINQIKDEPHQRSLQLIEQAAQDSAHVVKRILDFARLDSDTEFSPVSVNSLVEDVVELTRHKWHDEAHSKGQVVEVTTDVGDVPMALGNYSELREVLMNLVINAYEAIEGDGSISIKTFGSDKYAHIDITDTGMGMPPEIKEKVFEPFVTTKGSSGTGLGLSITLGIISRHNGTIEVESEEGKGTTMHISLPLAADLEEEIDDAPSQETGPHQNARILVVEDEPMIRETLSDMLDLGGHSTTLACNGDEGVSTFKEGDFDIVFTDLGMPGLSGWEVAKAIREQGSDVPIVMVTGWGVSIDRAELDENQVDEVLPKPFDIDQVLNLVQKLMGQDKPES